MIGIPLVTLLYILVNISYFTVMNIESMLLSPAVGTVGMGLGRCGHIYILQFPGLFYKV